MKKTAAVLLSCLLLLTGILFGCSNGDLEGRQAVTRPKEQHEELLTEQADGTKEFVIEKGSAYDAIESSAPKAEVHHIVNDKTGVNELKVDIIATGSKLTDSFRNYLNQVKMILLNSQKTLTQGGYTLVTMAYSEKSEYKGLPVLHTFALTAVPKDGEYVLEKKTLDEAIHKIVDNPDEWKGQTKEDPDWVTATLYALPATEGVYNMAK